MVLGDIVLAEQKCLFIFVDSNEKINTLVYEEFLNRHIVLWVKATYPVNNLVFLQDGAPAHNAAVVQAKLTEELSGPDHFWRKGM